MFPLSLPANERAIIIERHVRQVLSTLRKTSQTIEYPEFCLLLHLQPGSPESLEDWENFQTAMIFLARLDDGRINALIQWGQNT